MEQKSPSLLAAERAIAILGGSAKAACLLNVKGHRRQTVQAWLKNGVPPKYCPVIEQETRLRGDPVFCEELQPDVLWSVLRGKRGAPKVPAAAARP